MSKLTKALTAAAGNAGGDNLYVEDVFSTYLYEGNGATQTITNGIDLNGEGGLTWIKNRDNGARHHGLFDTERGATKALYSNQSWAEGTNATYLNAFNSNGFTVGSAADFNGSGEGIASWTFRKAKKFFDVVTYSSDTTSGARTLSHNLGSTPAFILVKGLNFSDSWYVYHIGTGVNKYLELNLTGAGHASTNFWGVTDSTFTVDGFLNNNGSTGKDYVAYLFASDAGGFGDDGSESVIKCGSYTGDGSTNNSISVGFEPQWLMIKHASGAGNPWAIYDSMRGTITSTTTYDIRLEANSISAEQGWPEVAFTADGFKLESSGSRVNTNTENYIYIAIRRPMKTPESGTEIFTVDTPDSTSPPKYRSSFPVDMAWFRSNINSGGATDIAARLTGTKYLNTNATSAEANQNSYTWDFQNGWYNDQGTETNNRSWMFKRATGFFDVVVPTATQTLVNPATEHTLGVVPEFIISKSRDSTAGWFVYHSALGLTKYLELSTTSAFQVYNVFGTTLTSTQFQYYSSTVGESVVNYLFATLDGVSKVGSYNGADGANVDVDCGFSSGARFILIKRTNATGNWFYWDYQRGITAGNDPYLLLNSTAAQVTNTDYIDPLSSGFTVTAGASFDGLNNVGGTYIFLAIA